jgi:hypothetical protein
LLHLSQIGVAINGIYQKTPKPILRITGLKTYNIGNREQDYDHQDQYHKVTFFRHGLILSAFKSAP